ncbi:MAG: DUF4177 domain-containing protein [Ruminococcus sp.]|nr:DUF4177 domain-containing protein [Ruminococcus sp.]
MKKYKFIRMTWKMKMFKSGYRSSEKYGNADHREVIRNMALEGWRFVGKLPVDPGGYGSLMSYDLVFEKDCEN